VKLFTHAIKLVYERQRKKPGNKKSECWIHSLLKYGDPTGTTLDYTLFDFVLTETCVIK